MDQALNKEADIQKPKGSSPNTIENPLSKRTLYELFLLSTFIFVISALLLQFLMNLQTAILLWHYSISFTYSLFNILFSINYSSINETKWTPERIFIIYGLGMLLFFFAGILLLRVKVGNWKVRLAQTWLGFLMINTLPLGLLAGIYIYDGIGIAYTWLFSDITERVLIALIVLLIAIFCRPYWIFRFLRTVNSSAYLDNDLGRKKYIKYCFILPWCAGAGIVSVFALPHLTWFWFIFIFGLGTIILPGFRKAIPAHNIFIYKSKKKIFSVRYPVIYFITLSVVIWLISLIRISF